MTTKQVLELAAARLELPGSALARLEADLLKASEEHPQVLAEVNRAISLIKKSNKLAASIREFIIEADEVLRGV